MIRVGIGGWVFKPWRGEFYPKGLPQARELEYASRKLTTIEINGTFYGTQKPESFGNGRRRRPMISYFRSRDRALRPTGACSPKRANQSSASSRAGYSN